MLPFVLALIVASRVFFQSRTDIAVEVLALRQQVAILKRRRSRPQLRPLDRLFWTVLRATWPRRKDGLFIVKPETVVGWHRSGFGLYWRWKFRPRGGRPRITEEVRVPIRRWRRRTPTAARRKSMANCRSSASCSPRGPSRTTCGGFSAGVTRPRNG
jgi:hypothetical protein